MFFNKAFNLVYGKMLKELINDGVVRKILYYKIPAYTQKVDYQSVVDEFTNQSCKKHIT